MELIDCANPTDSKNVTRVIIIKQTVEHIELEEPWSILEAVKKAVGGENFDPNNFEVIDLSDVPNGNVVVRKKVKWSG